MTNTLLVRSLVKTTMTLVVAILFVSLAPASAQVAVKTPSKLESRVEQMLSEFKNSPSRVKTRLQQESQQMLPDGKILLYFRLNEKAPSDMQIRSDFSNFNIVLIKVRGNIAKVYAPIASIEQAAESLPYVRQVTFPNFPVAQGMWTSQGVWKTGAESQHAVGHEGAGAKVAIIDSNFVNVPDAISAGVLPSDLVEEDCSGPSCSLTSFPSEANPNPDSMHGTACAEIVHEMAPDSDLYLIKVQDATDLEDAVNYCSDHGIKIISCSLGYFNTNFYDGACWDGNPDCTVEDAYGRGILWVNAAGNYAQKHFEGRFEDQDNDGWDDRVITFTTIEANEEVRLFLTWDAWPITSEDYDLYVYDSEDHIVAKSTTTQSNMAPTESVDFKAPLAGTYYVRLKKAFATWSTYFELYSSFQVLSPSLDQSSLISPGEATHALTVAAMDVTPWSDNEDVEAYSSRGPRNTDGLMKPDITGPDMVMGYMYGYFYGIPFAGTSAATPHVAGAAALVLSEHPSYTVDQLWQALTASAIDMGSPGQDYVYGWGRLNLCVPPATPFITSQSPVPSGQSYDIRWTETGTDNDYQLQEASDSSFTNATQYEVYATDKVFIHSVADDTTYYYRVRAVDPCNDQTYYSDWSEVAQQTITAGGPVAPSNLSASSVSTSQIDLSWQYSGSAAGFKLERKTGAGGAYTQIATPSASERSYSDTGLSAGGAYYYRIRAYDSGGVNSGYSNEATATTQGGSPPTAPSSLTASAVSPSQINLQWSDNSSDETGFKIERKQGAGGSWLQIATRPSGTTTFQATSLNSDTTYYFQVRAYNDAGDSSYSNTAQATTFSDAPAAPSNLQGVAVSSTQVNLTWQDNASNEDGFDIERKVGSGGTFGIVGYAGENAQDYQDLLVSPNVTYYYRVRARNASGYSAYSNTASATTCVPPSRPMIDSPYNGQANLPVNIDLSWYTASDVATYDVYLSTSNPPATLLKSVANDPGQTTLSVTASNLTKGTVYYWKVVAHATCSSSSIAESFVSSFSTIGGLGPLTLLAPADNATGVPTGTVLDWDPVTSLGTVSYDLYFGTSNPPDFYINTAWETEELVTGLTANTTYYWKVVAKLVADTTITSTSAVRSFTTGTGSSTTVTLSAAKDAGLRGGSWANKNYGGSSGDVEQKTYGVGNGDYIFLNSGAAPCRGVVQFDLSSIPAGSNIVHATLENYTMTRTPPSTAADFYISPLTASWSELGITWNNCPSVNTTYQVVGTIPVSTGSPVTNDVTSLVKAWVNGSIPNYGIRLSVPAWESTKAYAYYFYQREWQTTDNTKLVITYGQPCNATSAPTLSSPANNATNQPASLTLDWSDVANASSYKVYLGATNPPPYYGLVTSSQLSVTLPSSNTVYYWKVEALADCDPSKTAASGVRSFTTSDCFAPAAPTLNSPSNGAGSQPKSVTLSWGAVTGASGYKVYLDTANPPSTLIGTPSSPSFTITVSAGSSYYWKVTAVASCDSSLQTDSAVWGFTTPPAPYASAGPSQTATTGEAVTVGGSPVAWGGTSPYQYKWSIVSGSGGTLSSTSISTPTFSSSTTGTFTLELVVTDSLGYSSSPSQTTVIVSTSCTTPAAPVLTAPASGKGGTTYSVSWTSTSSDNTYELMESTDPSFTGVSSVLVSGTANSENHTVVSQTTYYYKVRAKVVCEGIAYYSSWSNVAQAVISPTCSTPSAPIMSAPASGTSGSGYTVTWSSTSPSNLYNLDESVDPNFATSSTYSVNGTSKTLTHSVSSQTTYYYRASAIDNCGGKSYYSEWSARGATVVTPVCTVSCIASAPMSGMADQPLNFSSVASGDSCSGSVTYDWDFGDGSPHSALQNPTHIYATAGTYSWTLTAAAGATTCTKSGSITIQQPPVISAFSAAPGTINLGQSSLLTWSVTGATSLSIDHGVGDVTGLSSTWVSPSTTTNYTLTATNDAGATTAFAAVTVIQPPQIDSFAAVPAAIFPGQSTTLTWSVTGATSLSIDHGVGDVTGLSSKTLTPSGTTTYTLTATNAAGPVTSTATVTVGAPLSASISSSAIVGTTPFSVDLTSDVSGGDGAYTYNWNFGDGTTANTANPTKVYNTAGNYQVTLTVTDGPSHTVTSNTLNIIVYAPLTVSLSASPTSGMLPLEVAFTATAQGGDGHYTYSYDYGDVTSGSESNHTYATAGTYTAKVTVTDTSSHTTLSTPVTIRAWAPLTVSISASATTGTAPHSVDFTSDVSGGDGSYTYNWNFGDGTMANTENPTKVYTAGGDYQVILTVTDGSSHTATSDTLSMTVYAPLTVSLTASPASGTLPLPVTFSAAAAGGDGHYAYTYDYGDGTTGSDPNHTYTTAGTYAAKVTVTDTASHTATSDPVTVSVWAPLAASISASATSGPPPLSVDFTSNVTGGDGSYAYNWDFRDGTTASTANPTKVYTAAGNYQVILTVTDGSSHMVVSNTIAITVVNPPVVTTMQKVGNPFRIKVYGSNLQNGIKVYINGQLWGDTSNKHLVKWKSSSMIVIKKGHALKALVPKNTDTTFKFVNPDGGEATVTWRWP